MLDLALRRLVLGTIFFTGFAGLVYEVTWHRYLANLVGSQARAAALILAVFLGGLCVGYALFGKLSKGRSPARLVSICGWTEIGIGVWGLIFPQLYSLVWSHWGILDPNQAAALGVDALICILLIGFPTVLMGGTLPLLTQGMARDLDDASRFHAKVYALNTGGAFVGCLAAGFIIIPQLGLAASIYLIAPLNLLAGMILVKSSSRLSRLKPTDQDKENHSVPSTFSFTRGLIIAFLAGFTSLSLQTIFIRLIGLTIGSSEYAFSMIVAVYILMIALGAWKIADRQVNRVMLWNNQLCILVGILILYFIIPYWPYAAHVARTLFTGTEINFYLFHGLCFLLVAAVLAVPVGAMGRSMPLLFGVTKNEFGDLGTNVGKLYASNTLGCVAGAICGGYLLLFWLDIDQVYLICASALALSAVLVGQNGAFRYLAMCFLLSPLILPLWDKMYFAAGTFRLQERIPATYSGREAFYKQLNRGRELVAYRDGPNTSVGVIDYIVHDSGEKARALYVNGKSDGSTAGQDLRTTRLLAHLPALLSKSSSSEAAIIGYGTGITVRSLAAYADISRIQTIEIAPIVRDFAPLFDFATDAVSKDPKLEWSIGDAYRVLGASNRRYGIIISEPSNPWVTGVEKLFSQEFYQIVRSRLETGGIYAQWFHTYSTSVDALGIIIRTFHSVFPNVRIFHTPGDFVILGSMQPIELNLSRLNPDVDRELKAIGTNNTAELLATELWLSPDMFPAGKVHTLERPILAFRAGKDFFMGKPLSFDPLYNTPAARQIAKQAADSALFAKWFQNSADKFEELKLYAQAVCKSPLDSKAWENNYPPCRSALVALAANRQIAAGPLEPALPILDVLSGRSSEKLVASTLELAERTVEGFALWDSPFLKLKIDRLREVAALCFRDRECNAYAEATLGVVLLQTP